MGMTLIIAEKPSLGKAIAERLGIVKSGQGHLVCKQDRVVTWAFGHLFEDATPDEYGYKQWRLEDLPIVPKQWKKNPRKDAKAQLKIIGDLLKKVQVVVHAGDPDREGQAIIDDILQHYRFSGKVWRLWLSALDPDSVDRALKQVKDNRDYVNFYEAAIARKRADWLVGMNATRYFTLKSKERGVKTIGRVQTPTLALVVKRDMDIEHFKPLDWFTIEATIALDSSGAFKATWKPSAKTDEEGRCLDRAFAEQVAKKITKQKGQIKKAETKRKKDPPPMPYYLATLQKDANAKFGFSAQKTLEITQRLYEHHKAVTYPRTDCAWLPESQHKDAPNILKRLNLIDQWTDPSRKHKAFDDKKITAHHAIVPTGVNPTGLSADEQKLFDLICVAYKRLFMPDHVYDATSVTFLVQDEWFTANGRVIVEEGWKLAKIKNAEDAKEKEKDEIVALPPMKTGDTGVVEKADVLNKKTEPPKRFTDGTLIEAMSRIHLVIEDETAKKVLRENAGIGTEATRSGIIENLVKWKDAYFHGTRTVSHSIFTRSHQKSIDDGHV